MEWQGRQWLQNGPTPERPRPKGLGHRRCHRSAMARVIEHIVSDGCLLPVSHRRLHPTPHHRNGWKVSNHEKQNQNRLDRRFGPSHCCRPCADGRSICPGAKPVWSGQQSDEEQYRAGQQCGQTSSLVPKGVSLLPQVRRFILELRRQTRALPVPV